MLSNKTFKNIAQDLQNGLSPVISVGTQLYAGKDPFRLSYTVEGDPMTRGLYIYSYHHFTAKVKMKVVGITGNAYIP